MRFCSGERGLRWGCGGIRRPGLRGKKDPRSCRSRGLRAGRPAVRVSGVGREAALRTYGLVVVPVGLHRCGLRGKMYGFAGREDMGNREERKK